MAPELGRRVDHAGEQLILAEIIGHRRGGLSWARVADQLTADGHHTRTGADRESAVSLCRVRGRASILPGTACAKRWSGGAGRPAGVYR